jgi:cytochrome c oxidase subunit 2
MRGLFQRLAFLPEQASTFAQRVDRLHLFIFATTFAVAAGIGVVGLYFLIRYRAREAAARTQRLEAPAWLEALFVAVPLGVFLLWFVIGFRDYVWVRSEAPPSAMDVYVTAKQWMWKFSYPSGVNSIAVLHVPVGRPVRLLMTSRDVIHSFFVPSFRLKQDVVPGRYTEIWFEARLAGHFQIFCAEYCGLNHSYMWGEVLALPPEEFDRWLDEETRGLPRRERPEVADVSELTPAEDLRTQGERVAAQAGCLKCHSVDGSPHIGPTWLDLYHRVETMTTGEKVVANEAYLTESMMDPLARVVAGFNPVMPSFQGQLTPAETAAIIEFIKSLRSGQLVKVPAKGPSYEPVR